MSTRATKVWPLTGPGRHKVLQTRTIPSMASLAATMEGVEDREQMTAVALGALYSSAQLLTKTPVILIELTENLKFVCSYIGQL